ncbi:hypothetical protein DAPPUDRAFT_308901 [Daphnia pulex]|uniref:Uncharacterized protein n=1 Tax=Daphnia pulex TaxID=6669 RepID=E9HA59_DAPPU|nr:hypothetical protein DAPPUDRAFT_308901 [Daphnia pulex]|eukprot:EFX71374.1 hypothetical protein DAPPUDRAFT_308901 [Daphnia pulex]
MTLTFKKGHIYLHTSLSEQLLNILGQNGKINDETLPIFNSSNTRLEKVIMHNATNLSCKGLRTLKQHHIVDLEATQLKVTISELISSLSDWTIENLRSLVVSDCTFVDSSKVAVMVSLSRLKNLRTLNVSYTEFNNHGLEIIVEDLRHLECLDLSETRVSEISPLRKCRTRLRALVLHNLKISDAAIPVIIDLPRLRHLDVSRNSNFSSRFQQQVYVLLDHITPPLSLSISELLLEQGALPELEHLDISGCDRVDIDALAQFIQCHRSLTFLGLLDCEACYDSMFVEKISSHTTSLMVTGSANEEQILESLVRYPKRIRCTQKSLYELFSLTQQFDEPRVDVIQLVLRAMRLHPEEFHIQMAATACVYNLTKGDVGQKIHPHILKEVVHYTLAAMENFPNHLQLQKNTLLTLCSDRILQDVTFDRYRCARLVLDCLCIFEDSSMGRMSVAICSILAAKISTSETTVLGSTPKYMRKLLAMVRTKMESNQVDITLKFTLSALWNLTDESPETCSIFLREGGLDLFLQVLEAFPGESTVETKILGLINNIAEVKTLRHRLIVDPFLMALHRLLRSPLIDVAYFAAGIIAHLASGGVEFWTSRTVPRHVMLEELGVVVMEWNSPESEMVAYRSFSPFFHLILCYEAPQVQLWALWAILHVCSKNGKRYCLMLYEEEGDEILSTIAANSNASKEVRQFCVSIMELLKMEGLIRNEKITLIPSVDEPNSKMFENDIHL